MIGAATRVVVCADALVYLAAVRGGPGVGSVVTSLPDAEEVGLGLDVWTAWFHEAAALAMAAASPHCPAVFYQTDRKVGGRWLSKAGLLIGAAEQEGLRLLWHKIVLRRPAGGCDLHRPGYAHLLAFSRLAGPGAASPDVLPPSPSVYRNGMPIAAVELAIAFCRRHDERILDPFCGRGTVLAAAEAAGMAATGVDIDPSQCAFARDLPWTSPAEGLS